MGEDYLATDFAKAKDKLQKAIASCGSDNCAAGLRASLRRDLGVVYFGGGLDKAKAREAFIDAVRSIRA